MPRIAIFPLLAGCGLSCVQDPDVVEPAGPREVIPGCQDERVREHYSFDARHSYGRGPVAEAHAPAPAQVDCQALQQYEDAGSRSIFHGCSVHVSDHLHTAHIFEQVCRRGADLSLRNALLEDAGACMRGSCIKLDGFTDPLKFQQDAQEQASAAGAEGARDGLLVPLGRELSLVGWWAPDRARFAELPQLDFQQLVRAEGLAFGIRQASPQDPGAGQELSLDLSSGEQRFSATLGFEPATRPGGDMEFHQLAVSARRSSDQQLAVQFFADGESIGSQSLQLPVASGILADGYAIRLEALGSRLVGRLDELLLLDEALDEAEVRGLYEGMRAGLD